MSDTTSISFNHPLPRQVRGLNLLQLLATWHRRSAGRADLARLDARALKDVGISRFEAEVEASKPFWQM